MDNVRLEFEAWWCVKYEFEMKRGNGRLSRSLKRLANGDYMSDSAKEAFEVWCAAKGVKQ